MISFRPISISLSPNVERDDIDLALKLIFGPSSWKNGEGIERLEEEFKKYSGAKYAISFNSGRSALLSVLKNLGLKGGDEILLQAFTCNAVVNPILWANLTPVFVDCNDNNFNIDLEDFEKKITPKARILIVQHTFGLSADMDKILEICQKNNLILIEDCAHSLGAKHKEKKVGAFGKIAFFSFSRDKVISSVYGGMVITNDDALAKKLKNFQEKIGYPSFFWIFQQLLHPILLNFLILPTYSFFRFGKTLLNLFQWLHILSKAVTFGEKRGKQPKYFPKKLPNALAVLALNQFKKLEKFNLHREKIASFYHENLKNSDFELPLKSAEKSQVFLRFTLKHLKAHQIIKKAWSKNILIGDWYDKVIAPHDTKLDKMRYKIGSCPKAEKLAQETFNLPTHINISLKEAQKIVDFINNYGD
jgi:dTDP-4-amino-4,6-dideoxygalactose transaminase